MGDVIEFRPVPEPKVGYTVRFYYGPDGLSSAHVAESVRDACALAEDLEKVARSLRAQAGRDEDRVVATVQIFRSSHVLVYMDPRLTDADSRAWLSRRIDDARSLFDGV